MAAGGGDSGVVALLNMIKIGQDQLEAKVAKVAAGQQELAAGQQELKSDVLAIKSEMSMDDASSWMSPTGAAYEDLVNVRIDQWLYTFCGLRVVPSGRRGIAHTDPAAGGQQWDARFSVQLDATWAPPRAEDANKFYVYGGGNYGVPSPLPPLRTLSPSKQGEAPDAHYFSVLEFTSFPEWTDDWKQVRTDKVRKALPLRLETRLAICLNRFKEAGNPASSTVLDAVALVGVVSVSKCQESIESLLSSDACVWPLLKQMFLARRFVFFYCFVASPRARSLVLGAEAGRGEEHATSGGAGSASP